ncbi:hypothetical protein EVAR_80490_1 [Eumeta japonica]|uniref:Uncharacterized protein n=1 Tax=Eumeta variegata TaxID=151549 RepID=A0A4C1ZJB6_EUMVA|nr:hypothetical protein EVAR_80490_1 [Eumeta japonica]
MSDSSNERGRRNSRCKGAYRDTSARRARGPRMWRGARRPRSTAPWDRLRCDRIARWPSPRSRGKRRHGRVSCSGRGLGRGGDGGEANTGERLGDAIDMPAASRIYLPYAALSILLSDPDSVPNSLPLLSLHSARTSHYVPIVRFYSETTQILIPEY